MYVEKFQQNEKIFNRGDEGDTFFVILKGEVAVVREEEGKEVIVVTLGVGACFGELSLLDGRPRTATMVCVTDTTCAVLSKDDYTNLLLSAKKEQLERKVEFLAQHPFFSGWSRMALNRVSYHFELETFKGGSMIYQEGDKAEKVYFIQAGEFRFEKLQIIQQYKEKDAKWLKKPFKLRRFQSRPRYQISIRSEKQIFGDDEVIERVPRRQTAI